MEQTVCSQLPLQVAPLVPQMAVEQELQMQLVLLSKMVPSAAADNHQAHQLAEPASGGSQANLLLLQGRKACNVVLNLLHSFAVRSILTFVVRTPCSKAFTSCL